MVGNISRLNPWLDLPSRATAIGFIAVVLWALLAALIVLDGTIIPPFQLVAMSFTVATALGEGLLASSRGARQSLEQVPATGLWLGIGGLFGFHLFYFIALQSAPAVEASLVVYLWPVLIVLFAAAIAAALIWTGYSVSARLFRRGERRRHVLMHGDIPQGLDRSCHVRKLCHAAKRCSGRRHPRAGVRSGR